MNNYNLLKNELIQINQDLLSLLSNLKSLPGLSGDSFNDWEEICRGVNKRISEEIIRVAVVGPIKSGKSTFINALLHVDYLKRGAGVVTSIVTRIRGGRHLKADLMFKAWDEVNSEMEQALALFPSMDRHHETGSFDIRRNHW